MVMLRRYFRPQYQTSGEHHPCSKDFKSGSRDAKRPDVDSLSDVLQSFENRILYVEK
jgi:hypothetical protein